MAGDFDEEEESTEKQSKNKTEHLKPWQFKPGQSGNPAGRPPVKTLKEFARSYLAGMTDEERIAYFEGMDKKVIWEMAEGKPEAVVKSTVNVNNLSELPDDELDRIIKEGTSD